MFFILSGYLISASWEQYPRFNVFIAKRSLRIFPGLIVATVSTVVIVGFFFSSLSLWSYFTDPATLQYLNNIFLINAQYFLPGGAFSTNPFPNAINGSIWTLAYEFLMYITVGVFGAIGLYKRISIKAIWLGLFILQIIINITGTQHFNFIIFYFQFNQLVVLALMFFTGVLVQKKAFKLHFTPYYGLLSLVAFATIVSLLPRTAELMASTLLAYSLFALGNSARLSWFGRYGDFSYGIYIYSFPIQQMTVSLTEIHSAYRLFIVALPLSVVAGALSWWLIESRMLGYKKRINTDRYPLQQNDIAW